MNAGIQIASDASLEARVLRGIGGVRARCDLRFRALRPGRRGLVDTDSPLRAAVEPEPEPDSLPTTSRPPAGPLQAYYWPTSSQLVGNHSDVDPIG
jgi:hypothetical protein